MFLIPCKSYNVSCYQLSYQNFNIPPGFLQYKVSSTDIKQLDKLEEDKNYDSKWTFISHTKENLEKLTPDTRTGTLTKWKILFIIECGNCMKGALQNLNSPDEYALMTSINLEEAAIYQNRLLKSLHDDYKICQCKMIAPAKFWNELKNRLIY